jgi:hypothetical protein
MSTMPLVLEQTGVPAPALIPPYALWPAGTRWVGNSSETIPARAIALYEPCFPETVVLVARPWAPWNGAAWEQWAAEVLAGRKASQ